ncbi:hypothetical protein, partial [Pseudoalteromonas nigrifaciens]|uniref:hypothetical protein n=1 Tax=Pseudoalteromonas nigrifaciens TaxID=28109 RepID=UPI003FB752D4
LSVHDKTGIGVHHHRNTQLESAHSTALAASVFNGVNFIVASFIGYVLIIAFYLECINSVSITYE